MKKVTSLLIGLSLAGVSFFAACKKEDPLPNRTELLTGGTWYLDYYFVDLNRNHRPDPSEKRDYDSIHLTTVLYSPDGSGVQSFRSGLPSQTFDWHFEDNEQDIRFRFPQLSTSGIYEIATLTANQLIFRDEYHNAPDVWRVMKR